MQTAEQNHVYMIFCPLSKNCQLENELISTDYTSLVGEKLFLDVRKGHKSENKVHCSWFCRTCSLTILRSSKFTCKGCVMELNRAADALRTNSEIVIGCWATSGMPAY